MIQINQLPSSADVIQTWNIGRVSPSIELRLKVKITPFHHCPRPAESRICMYGGKQARTVIKGMNPDSRAVGATGAAQRVRRKDAVLGEYAVHRAAQRRLTEPSPT